MVHLSCGNNDTAWTRFNKNTGNTGQCIHFDPKNLAHLQEVIFQDFNLSNECKWNLVGNLSSPPGKLEAATYRGCTTDNCNLQLAHDKMCSTPIPYKKPTTPKMGAPTTPKMGAGTANGGIATTPKMGAGTTNGGIARGTKTLDFTNFNLGMLIQITTNSLMVFGLLA